MVPSATHLNAFDGASKAGQDRPKAHDPGSEASPVEAEGVPVGARAVAGIEIAEMVLPPADEEVVTDYDAGHR